MNAPDFPIRQGNLLPLLDFQLLNQDGTAPDLTGLTVTFTMRPVAGCGGPIVSGAAAIIDAKGGFVEYTWQARDTDVPGLYIGEFTTVIGGKPLSFPNQGYVLVRVTPKVA